MRKLFKKPFKHTKKDIQQYVNTMVKKHKLEPINVRYDEDTDILSSNDSEEGNYINITKGIKVLPIAELKACLLHEIGHTVNKDQQTYFCGECISTKQAHKMEFRADKYSVKLGAQPVDLVKALLRIHVKFDLGIVECSHSHPSPIRRARALGINKKQVLELLKQIK